MGAIVLFAMAMEGGRSPVWAARPSSPAASAGASAHKVCYTSRMRVLYCTCACSSAPVLTHLDRPLRAAATPRRLLFPQRTQLKSGPFLKALHAGQSRARLRSTTHQRNPRPSAVMTGHAPDRRGPPAPPVGEPTVRCRADRKETHAPTPPRRQPARHKLPSNVINQTSAPLMRVIFTKYLALYIRGTFSLISI